jgi:single-strand DNA-binding protein
MKSFQNNIPGSEIKKLKKENAPDIISKSMFNQPAKKSRYLNLLIMSNLRNQVQLIGNVGNAPEIKNFESGKKVSSFSLATNEYYHKEGEKIQQTDWHNVVAWGKQAELIEKYVDKGKEVAIRGKLTSRSYETETGEKRYVTEILVSEILFLGSNESSFN